MTNRKRFIAKQAIGGLLASLCAVALLAILFVYLPHGLWTVVGLGVGGAIAVSVLYLVRSRDHQIY